MKEQEGRLNPFLKYFITVGCGVVVANLYYCQPLLGALARWFDVSEEAASIVNICSQLGYGLGLFFLVPLGDKVERRKILIGLHIMAAGSLIGISMSPTIGFLYFFCICTGIASTACQIFIPLAAHLAAESERGEVLGTVMGGLLTGILLSRTLSGFVADFLGWQSVYYVASILMLLMTGMVWKYIPREQPSFRGSYIALMRSLWQLFVSQRVIRESAWIGAFLFGSISVFWATMAFYLEKPPFQYSLSVIGLFGIIGAGGALISPFVGKITDRSGPFRPMRWGILFMIVGWLFLFKGNWSIAVVIAGIIFIDLGMQATHIPNLARNYALLPEARTRLNTLYMTAFFIGGTVGSTIGTLAWNAGKWNGVCIAGLVMVIAGAVPVFWRQSFGKRKVSSGSGY